MKKKRYSRRERANRIYLKIYAASVKRRKLSTRQIARYEHLSMSRTYFYLRYLKRSNVGQCLQKIGHTWIYSKPKGEQAPGIIGGITSQIEDDHDKLVNEEDSHKIEYMEQFYARKLRQEKLSFHSVQTKINEISRLSLSAAEKAHILMHLA